MSVKKYVKKRIVRSITKEKKYYLFDWTRINESAVRFENYVAFELFNLVTFLKDHGYGEFDLFYVRNRNGEETDFLITFNSNPWVLFEIKLNKESITSQNIKHSLVLGDILLIQLVFKNKIAKKSGKNKYIISASWFLAKL